MLFLKKLVSQSAIYGLSSIVGRLVNYLLVPIHTSSGVFSVADYGAISEMYTYVAFLLVFMTYGMETAYFRFASKLENQQNQVYSSALWSLIVTSVAVLVLVSLFSSSLAGKLNGTLKAQYITWFALVLVADVVSSIPMARLRQQNRPLRFAAINLAGIAITFIFNLFFIYYIVPEGKAGTLPYSMDWMYVSELGIGYVFIANLVGSLSRFVFILPVAVSGLRQPNWVILKSMLIYGLPLMVAGFAGIINETIDRLLLKNMLWKTHGGEYAMTQLGIYSANYKLSIVITLMVQAFRYAAEPFFFSQEKQDSSKKSYAIVLNWFAFTLCGAFVCVTMYLDLFKYFINDSQYWEGLEIVPILMMANIFLGLYYSMSVWYKLSGETKYGAYISFVGVLVTISINLAFIPYFGYVASAWATFVCYLSMLIVSSVLGSSKYKIPYNYKIVIAMLATAAFAVPLRKVLNGHSCYTIYITGFIATGTFVAGWYLILRRRLTGN